MTVTSKRYRINWKGEVGLGDEIYGKESFTMTIDIRDDGRFSGRSRGLGGRADIEGRMTEERIDFVQTYPAANPEGPPLNVAYVVHTDAQPGDISRGDILRGLWSMGSAYDAGLSVPSGGFSTREIVPLSRRLANTRPVRYIRNLIPQRKAA